MASHTANRWAESRLKLGSFDSKLFAFYFSSSVKDNISEHKGKFG